MAEPALEELTNLAPEISIEWKAFELRPHPVPTLDPNGDYLTSAWQNHVYPLAQKMGFIMRKPPVQPRTRLAHAAAKWAAANNRFNEYNSKLFRAFFHDGLDIGMLEILIQIADKLDLNASDLESALKNDTFTQEVLHDQAMARQANVRAVPAYVLNKKVLAAGVQSASRLEELISSSSN